MNFLAFLIAALSGISFRLFGIVFVSELLLASVAVFFCGKPKYNKYIKKGLLLLLVWMAGGIIANLYNHIPSIPFVKGVFSRIFFLLDIIGLYVIFENKPKRILCFLAGFMAAAVLSIAAPTLSVQAMDIAESGGDFEDDYYGLWGIYLCLPLVRGAVSLLYYIGGEILALICICLFAYISLFFVSRNIFLSWTIAALMLILLKVKIFENFNFLKKVIFLFSVVLVFICIKDTYSYLAENDYLGERAYKKYQMQSSEKLGLLSGRADFFMSLMAISENPIFGYGDYAPDSTNIRGRFSQKFLNEYVDSYNRQGFLKMMPGHSYILGSWVYNGILAFPFWIYFGYLILIMLKKYANREPKLLAANLLLIIPFIFDYFFSPFGGRILPALTLVYLCVFLDHYSEEDHSALPKICMLMLFFPGFLYLF